MRILVFFALLPGILSAQTPPPKFLPVPQIQPRLIFPSNRQFFLPGSQALPHPVGACAIPLINVQPKAGFNVDPKMVIPGSPQIVGMSHMPVAQGLPPCPEVSRK